MLVLLPHCFTYLMSLHTSVCVSTMQAVEVCLPVCDLRYCYVLSNAAYLPCSIYVLFVIIALLLYNNSNKEMLFE